MELINVKSDVFYKEFCQAYHCNPGKDELEETINNHKEEDTKLDNDKIGYYGNFDKKEDEYKENGILLERCKQVLEIVDLYYPKLRIDTIPIAKGLKILTKEHQKHSLITKQLHGIVDFIEDYILHEKLNIKTDDECFIYDYYEFNKQEAPYDFEDLNDKELNKMCLSLPPAIIPKPKFDLERIRKRLLLKFKWKYTEDDILDAVCREVGWRKAKRDITIYKERRKGVFIKDLMKTYNLDKGSISRIDIKVRGKVNYLKGHLFEQEYKKYLESLKLYDKVVWDGASGKPDIVCYKENTNQADVYSLKCLKITKKAYHILKKDLAPEYKMAFDLSFSYKIVNLFLVVFNYVNNSIKTIPLDWKNPKNVVIK